jgi:hypothetical protein
LFGFYRQSRNERNCELHCDLSPVIISRYDRLVIPSHWVSNVEGKHSAMISLVLRLAAEDQQIQVAAVINQICDSSTWRKCKATPRKNRQSFGATSLLHQQRLELPLLTSLLVIRSAYCTAAAAVNAAGERMSFLHISPIPTLPPSFK